MALSNIQERLERSVFEQIRLRLVREGFLPDVTTYANTPAGAAAYKNDMQQLSVNSQFPIELFGVGGISSKQSKQVPRISIHARRMQVGEIGTPIQAIYQNDPLSPGNIQQIDIPLETTNFQLDIHLVSGTVESGQGSKKTLGAAAQERLMNALIGASLGTKKYIPYYDDPTSRFFIKQYNYYDIPDSQDGITEKIFSYEIPDIYLYKDVIDTNAPKITSIKVSTVLQGGAVMVGSNGSQVAVDVTDNGIYIDTSGITYPI